MDDYSDLCTICWNNIPDIITSCNHKYCYECVNTMKKHNNMHNTCAKCRVVCLYKYISTDIIIDEFKYVENKSHSEFQSFALFDLPQNIIDNILIIQRANIVFPINVANIHNVNNNVNHDVEQNINNSYYFPSITSILKSFRHYISTCARIDAVQPM